MSDALHNSYMAMARSIQSCWGNWPPTDRRIMLGAYGWANGMTFNYVGNIGGDEFDIDMTPWTPQGSANWNLVAEDMSVTYLQAQASGQSPIPVETINGNLDFETEVQYASRSGSAFRCVYNGVTFETVGKNADTSGYLSALYPELKAKGFNFGKHALTGAVYLATGAAFAGGQGSLVSFGFSANAGATMEGFLGGSLSAQVTVTEGENCDISASTDDIGAPVPVGFVLYHFDSSGVPHEYWW